MLGTVATPTPVPIVGPLGSRVVQGENRAQFAFGWAALLLSGAIRGLFVTTVNADQQGLLFTRLETRTKESRARASIMVIETRAERPRNADLTRRLLLGSFAVILSLGWGATATEPDQSEKALSLSTYSGTRKPVNYSRPGGSQGKPWWTSVSTLTCKSFDEFGYRGERLIEPSRSWFPPKFPSG